MHEVAASGEYIPTARGLVGVCGCAGSVALRGGESDEEEDEMLAGGELTPPPVEVLGPPSGAAVVGLLERVIAAACVDIAANIARAERMPSSLPSSASSADMGEMGWMR